MWRILAAALLVGVGPAPLDDDPGLEGIAGGPDVLFRAALARNGMSAWNDLPAGFPAPTVAWLGSAPTLNSVDGSTVFTVAGTPDDVDTPFCPDGTWDDLTGGCMTAKRFVQGTERYDGTDVADCTGDCSFCGLVRLSLTNATYYYIASQADSTPDGWVLYLNSGVVTIYVKPNGVGAATATSAGDNRIGQWVLACGTVDADGNIVAYKNGAAGTGVARPAGTVTSGGSGMDIAGLSAYGSEQRWPGDIAWVSYWQGTALTAAQMRTLADWVMGLHEEKGAAPTFTNTGPTCCWIAGQLECFSDDFPRKGCEIPPGETGAGSPATCAYHAHPTVTNSLLRSRELNTTWTAVGTSVVATSTASVFGDGRTMYKVTDDDGAAHEYIHQTIAKSGATAEICVTAVTESGAGVVTVGLQETTGACAGAPAEVELGEIVTGTTATRTCFARTHTDADCTSIKIVLYPVDTDGGVTETGHAAMLAEVFHGIAYAPGIYVETTTAGVASGNDQWTTATTTLPANSAMIVEATVIPFWGTGCPNTSCYVWDSSNRGTQPGLLFSVTAGGGLSAAVYNPQDAFNSGVLSWAAGTTYRMRFEVSDSSRISYRDGVLVGSDATVTTTLTGHTTGRIGFAAATEQFNGCIQDLRFSRP